MWYYDYEPTKRKEVKGGIQAVSRRGRFGTTWWGQRWIDTLEGFDIGARLNRGKSYARSGQVLSIDVEKGGVAAKVQGSRATPYQVSISLAEHTDADWKRVIKALRKQPYYAARLLAGGMPPDLEDLFGVVGLSLFPKRGRDLLTDCSCPDWSNPCKHIAAVYYLLAEEFDRDPFLLLRLRGMTREELMTQVVGDAAQPHDASKQEQAAPPTPLTPDAAFWQADPLPTNLFGPVRIPPTPAALPKRLGKFPFWRAAQPLAETMEAVYKKASPRGLTVFLNEEE